MSINVCSVCNVFWDWMLQKSEIYKWRIPRKFPQELYPIQIRRAGRILAMYLMYIDHRTKCAASYIHSHPMSQPPILNIIFPLSIPKGRLRAHGTVLVRREGTITSVDDLWSGYLLSSSAGDLACGIQRDGSYFDSPNTGRRKLFCRYFNFFTLITKLT